MIEKQMTLDDLLKNIKFIKRLYDVARIVDPIQNQVLHYKDYKLIPLPSKCYDVWERNDICDDCISRNALEKDETYAKIEYLRDKVYMILAMPIQLKEKKVILELLRDITKERILFDSVDTSKKDAYSLLRNRNINIIKDGLTNIFNNRYVNERLPYDIMNSHIKGEYLSILMIDIDNFREINKGYSHNCGNIILMEFAKVLEDKMKHMNGWVARYTADTFVAVLVNYSPKEASQWAENLRGDIEKYDFFCDDEKHIFITSSIGMYTKEKVDESMEKYIKKAKLFLGRAKEKGKNCVVSNGEK